MDRALYGKEHPYMAGDYSNIASALMQRGQHAEAIGLLRQAETITKKLLPATRVQLAGVYQKLGRCFVALEDYAHAEPALRKAFVIRRKREKGTQGDDRIDVLEDLVDLYDAWGRPRPPPTATRWRPRPASKDRKKTTLCRHRVGVVENGRKASTSPTHCPPCPHPPSLNDRSGSSPSA